MADNGVGGVGVAPGVKIMPLKIQSGGNVGRVSAAIAAIEYAVAMGADVMTNSWAVSAAWGEPGWDQPGFAPALQAAIEAAGAADVLFVATAGNSAEDKDQLPLFPAAYPSENLVAVAATDDRDRLASWSSFGRTTVDLAAPGVAIFSTVPQSCNLLGPPPSGGACDGSGYLAASGTSMATPHVAGVAALIRSRFPSASVAEVKARLLYSVDPLSDLEDVTVSGGRLNAASALEDDPIAPAAVSDLAVVEIATEAVTLAWTATGDDGHAGRARRYDLRYATHPFDEASFAPASSQPPRPGPAGARETVRVEGLEPSMQYHFVVRGIDNVGNASPVSNVAVVTTLPVDPPEAHWSFHEGAGTTVGDASGNGNVGVLTDGARWVAGPVGAALELDGSGAFVAFADAGLSAGFPGRSGSAPGSFSLVAWVQPRTHRYQMIAAKDGHAGRSFNLALRADGLPEAQLFTPDARQLVGSAGAPLGRWTHLALVHDLSASQIRLYVDGQAAGAASSGDAIRASSSEFRLGARDLDPYLAFFDGAIDEALVFQRALTDQEVSSLARGGVPWRRWEPGCGIGAELAVVLSLIAGLRRRA